MSKIKNEMKFFSSSIFFAETVKCQNFAKCHVKWFKGSRISALDFRFETLKMQTMYDKQKDINFEILMKFTLIVFCVYAHRKCCL